MTSDHELMERWRSGDQGAGNELFERHFTALYRFFRGKVPSVAEDLVQQTFLACVQQPSAFRGDASFRSYLFTIARSKLYDYFRSSCRKDAVLDPMVTSLADLADSPSLQLAKREEQRLIAHALTRLPLDLQLAVELFYVENLPAPEVAAVLGIPEGTVRSRLRRALSALREQVERAQASPDALTSTLHLVAEMTQRVDD